MDAPAQKVSKQTSDAWTTRKLLAWMHEAFGKHGMDSPKLCAELLLAHVIGCERLRLYMEADRPASPIERQTLRELVGRALKHEPVQYLIGEWSFYGVPVKVDRRVLIPRPSTETMVEQVLLHAKATHGSAGKTGEGLVIADVCTGSGCVAVALAKNLPGAHVIATDVSGEALDVAKENAELNGVGERVEFACGDMLEPVRQAMSGRGGAEGGVDYLVSNPPYVPDDEWKAIEANVKEYEPHGALRGGVDGLDFVRTLCVDGPRLLREAKDGVGGVMLIEVAASRAKEAADLARGNKLIGSVRIETDFEGLDRVVVAERA